MATEAWLKISPTRPASTFLFPVISLIKWWSFLICHSCSQRGLRLDAWLVNIFYVHQQIFSTLQFKVSKVSNISYLFFFFFKLAPVHMATHPYVTLITQYFSRDAQITLFPVSDITSVRDGPVLLLISERDIRSGYPQRPCCDIMFGVWQTFRKSSQHRACGRVTSAIWASFCLEISTTCNYLKLIKCPREQFQSGAPGTNANSSKKRLERLVVVWNVGESQRRLRLWLLSVRSDISVQSARYLSTRLRSPDNAAVELNYINI